MIWTDDKTEDLTRLWHAGYSGSQIARAIGGVTRSAVIGKARRLGLPLRAPSGRYSSRGRSGEPSLLDGRHPAQRAYGLDRAVLGRTRPDVSLNKGKVRAALGLPLAEPIPPPAETDTPTKSFDDLQEHHCRWPCGETQDLLPATPIFCGNPRVPGLSYCEPHARRAYQPPQPPQPRRRETGPEPAKVLEAA